MTERHASDAGTFLRPADAASRLGVHPKTLTRWAKAGSIRVVTLPSGHRRYAEADIQAMQSGGGAA